MFHGFAARVRVLPSTLTPAATTLQPLLGRTVQFDSETSVGPRICSPMAATTSAPPSSGKRTAICRPRPPP